MVEKTRDALSRLVKEQRAKLGLSLAQLVDRSGDQDLNASWVNRLELGQLREVPRQGRLESLARGLELPFQIVARAAARQFMGVESEEPEWSTDGTVQVVVARMGELDEAGRRNLAELADLFAKQYMRKDE
ncbi:hypothetical protein [Kitasatospora sp. NPDC005748]|uniref:hypothetical protein n=1 Tax=Kitasatospora sp. NPDC005748 TaxID=3157063 RepID=UPI0033D9D703